MTWVLRVKAKGKLAAGLRDERKLGLLVELENNETFNSVLFKVSFCHFFLTAARQSRFLCVFSAKWCL